jgi:subfamily B ATP-binding cassette protein MsbA
MVVITRIFDILDEEITIHDCPEAIPLRSIRKGIEFRGVSIRYPGTSRDALHNVSFSVPAGSVVSLVGPSGAGKSTLVHLLLRLYDPTAGAILIGGKDIRDYTLTSLRSHIRIVPQEPILFSGTVAENIRYGRFEASAEQVIAAAKAAELHDFIYTLPEKYETEIGERGVSLSGGQKQRLAFAMAILTNPSVLILDDSMSALDAETEERLRRALDRIMAGRTAFIITHRVATAMQADTIVVLDEGRVAEIGRHEELVESGGFYTRMYERQMAPDNEMKVFGKVIHQV